MSPAPSDSAPSLGTPRDLARAVARERVRGQLFGGAPTQFVVDRFTVLHSLGSGGMGTVYAAYDPRLDRDIALKLLRHDHDDDDIATRPRQLRLLREARAMAKLSHPNVGTVHDAGTVEHPEGPAQVWIAMELIDGEGLRAWGTRATPSVREILDAYLQFARGLAAAHRAGLVHRDVKPDNAMRDGSGRVRVLDFGLARPVDDVPRRAELDLRSLEHHDPGMFTQTGALVGTPAYMAPEQFDGRPADASSDQYSYCVALFEALWRLRPHEGASIPALAAARRAGPPAMPTRRRDVPSGVRTAILRGLQAEPADRWPSMDHLVRALERASAPVRPRVVVLGVGAALLATTAGAAWFVRHDPCGGAATELAAAWTPEAQQAAFDHVAAIGDGYGETVAPRLQRGVAAFTDTWIAEHRSACLAHDGGTSSAALLDRHMACLREGSSALGELGRIASEVDADGLAALTLAVHALPDPATCATWAADPRQHATPRPAAAEPLAQRLAALRMGFGAGRRAEVAPLLDDAVTQARALGHPGLLGEALLLAAQVPLELGDRRAAIPILREATSYALVAGDDATALDAWSARAWAQATGGDDGERATDGLEIVTAIAERLGDDPAVATLHFHLGGVHLARGERRSAALAFAKAVALRDGDDERTVMLRAHALGHLALVTDDATERLRLLGEVTRAWTHGAGAEHPQTLVARFMEAGSQPDPRAAFDMLVPVCADLERLHPGGRGDVASCSHELGVAADLLGENAVAATAFARAAANDPEHGEVVAAEAARFAGDPRATVRILEPLVVELRASTERPWFHDLQLADAELSLGRALLELGDPRGRGFVQQAHARHAELAKTQTMPFVLRRLAASQHHAAAPDPQTVEPQ